MLSEDRKTGNQPVTLFFMFLNTCVLIFRDSALEMLRKKTFLIFFGELGIVSKTHSKQEEIAKNDVFSSYSNLKNSGDGFRFPEFVCGVIRR